MAAQHRINKQKATKKINEWVLQSSMEITRDWWISDENDTTPITAQILENYWIETYLDNADKLFEKDWEWLVFFAVKSIRKTIHWKKIARAINDSIGR